MIPTQITSKNLSGIEYPSKRSRNCDNSLFNILASSLPSLLDHFQILNADGSVFKDLPALGARQELAWHPTDPYLIYFILGNQLRQMSVKTGLQSIVWTFDEYASITGRGKSDISEDGSHFVFEGSKNGSSEIFVYDCVKNIKGAALALPGVNNLYITPDNNVVVSYFPAGNARYCGVELFNSAMVFQRQLVNANGHLAICRDVDGSEIMLWTNSAENPVTLSDFPNGVIKVKLADASQVGLLRLGWSAFGPDSMSVDIAADSKLGCLVSTYGKDSNMKFANQIVLASFDPAQPVQIVCNHNSNVNLGQGVDNYIVQPRGAFAGPTSIVFGSNNGKITDSPNVWMVQLSSKSAVSSPELPSRAAPSTETDKYGEQWINMGSLPYDETVDTIRFNSASKTVQVRVANSGTLPYDWTSDLVDFNPIAKSITVYRRK